MPDNIATREAAHGKTRGEDRGRGAGPDYSETA